MIQFTVSSRYHHPHSIMEVFKRHNRLHQLKRVFGFLFESPLNGGRMREGSLHFPMEIIDELNSMGIGYSFTLTNVTVSDEFFEDPHTNEILKRYERPINGVIVAHDAVADFIRARFPGYKLRASCIYDFLSADEINAACERFDEVCVFPEVNKKEDVLKAITQKEKLTLFCTSVCLNLCGKKRRHHYYIAGQDHIAYFNHRKYGTAYKSTDHLHPRLPWCRAAESTPMVHDVDGLHAMGFSTFKITQLYLFESVYFKGDPVDRTFWQKHPLNPRQKRRIPSWLHS